MLVLLAKGHADLSENVYIYIYHPISLIYLYIVTSGVSLLIL